MTTDPLTFAQEALGCREFADYDTCIEHGGEGWPCRDALRVADLIKARDRAIRAAALEEAAGECEADASDWYGIFADIDDGDLVAIRLAMQERGKDIDNVSAHMFRRALHARARILRDRAQAIREG